MDKEWRGEEEAVFHFWLLGFQRTIHALSMFDCPESAALNLDFCTCVFSFVHGFVQDKRNQTYCTADYCAYYATINFNNMCKGAEVHNQLCIHIQEKNVFPT